MNELTSVQEFLRLHILDELRGGIAAAASRPLVTAAAIKFVATFRAQFSRDELSGLCYCDLSAPLDQ